MASGESFSAVPANANIHANIHVNIHVKTPPSSPPSPPQEMESDLKQAASRSVPPKRVLADRKL